MAQVQPALEDRWEAPIQLILKGGVVPQDALHVTALLEMGGWNDRRAREEFGFADLFEMGEELYRQIRARVSAHTFAGEDPVPWYKWVSMGITYYLRGLMFAMPMVISIVAMLTLRYSLWSYEDFGPDKATSIAIATMCSFLVTGGFTQAVARRGLFYISQKEYSLARRSTVRMILAGMVVAVAIAVLLSLLNVIVPFFPWSVIAYVVPYYLFLSLLWLSITVLYMMRQELIFTAITAGGIGAVWLLFKKFQWDIVVAQMISLGTSTVISLLIGFWLFKRQERRSDAGTGEAQMPRWSQVSRLLVPYFLFGVLYFGFLYLDRLLAWSVPAEVHPYPIWFEGRYELGLDWAILTLVMPMGLLELFINVFAKRLEHWQGAVPAAQWRSFNKRFQSAYLWQLGAMAVLATAGGIFVWLFTVQWKLPGSLRTDLFASAETRFVFVFGTIAYIFVSTGLLNSLMLFSLNYPWPAVRAMGLAVIADLIIGFLASRMVAGHLELAVLGLLAGAILFCVSSSLSVYKVLSKLDYMLYRSV